MTTKSRCRSVPGCTSTKEKVTARDLDTQIDMRLTEAHDLEELLLRANEHAAAVTLAAVPKYFKEIVLPDIKAVP